MAIDLLSFGLLAGFFGGFFGIGGGMVLIPLLLLVGFDMKSSIAISIMQMLFTSIFGTYLNFKNKDKFLKDAFYLGFGGFLGGLVSSFIIINLPNITLQYIFLAIIILAIYKVAFTSTNNNIFAKTNHKPILLIFIGLIIGIIAMTIGIGGSIMLVPILVSYMNYSFKSAGSLALFFVVFSSLAGFISLSTNGYMLYNEGIIVGTASLLGVYFGIKAKKIVNIVSYKFYILFMYVVILCFTVFNIIK